MKRRIMKKRLQLSKRYVRRELKHQRGYHAFALIKAGMDRMMATIDGALESNTEVHRKDNG